MEETQPHATAIEAKSPLPLDLEDGRDELNLAEFPLAAIADRVPDNQKTLVFEDKIFDQGKAETITRRLTISASDKFGLPTSLDDEVILGLIQLTKQSRFTERKVSFSRYQLIQILGWRHEGRSYERLEKSLMRWLGVTLYYDKAWWDKDEQSWVDESFHILDNVTLYDQERRLKKLRSGSGELPLSSFTWNEVVFRSFRAGYLKSVDLKLFRELQYAAAKRMYRFLDKRFYHKLRWEFNLHEFAREHVGLSRNYDTGQLKRRLQPAIEELEATNFLEPLSLQQRYLKIARGEWRIVFLKKAQQEEKPLPAQSQVLAQSLADRGITRSVAERLVREFSKELIELQVEVFDRLQRSAACLRNPAGFLVKSIRDGYAAPAAPRSSRATYATPSVKGATTPETEANSTKQAIDAYLSALNEAELVKLEATALAKASTVLAEGYRRSKSESPQAHAIYRRMLLERGALEALLDRRHRQAS